MGNVHAFPARRIRTGGTVHVMPEDGGGFTVWHESSSGNSWGHVAGPFKCGQDAIAAAYRANADTYGGDCDVFICPAALADIPPAPFVRGI